MRKPSGILRTFGFSLWELVALSVFSWSKSIRLVSAFKDRTHWLKHKHRLLMFVCLLMWQPVDTFYFTEIRICDQYTHSTREVS